ncbi:hypothetical protein ACPXB5_19980 [Micromonospora arida]|uniref:hypothetical protein n=1 Tax=Micromonospora arida TaxID=2203715 RepID=UPI003CF4F7D9
MLPPAIPTSTRIPPTTHSPLSSVPAARHDQTAVNATVITGATSHGLSRVPASAASTTSVSTQPITCHGSYGPLLAPVCASTVYRVSQPSQRIHAPTVAAARNRTPSSARVPLVAVIP